jgi:hypothetical protein
MEKLNNLANFFTFIGIISTSILFKNYMKCLEDDITTISLSEFNENHKEDFKNISYYSRKENKRLLFRLIRDSILPWGPKPVIIKGKIDN